MTRKIEFHDLTIEDKFRIDEIYRSTNQNNCECTFAINYMWRHIYNIKAACIHDCIVMRFEWKGSTNISFPVGTGDKRSALEDLLAMCREEGMPLVLRPLLKEDCSLLQKWFPNRFIIWPVRDDFDYIYSQKKLRTLSGKKMHRKRNHIARFEDDENWSYEPITMENIPECIQMAKEWNITRSDKWNKNMAEEFSVVLEGFTHWNELNLIGGTLRKRGRIVAFTVGEPLNSDTFVIHFEKAELDIPGAYPMINQQFVEHECQAYQYINREDDVGEPGLRKAKLSYEPEILLEKYMARNSQVSFADLNRDKDSMFTLWQTCFGDSKEFIDSYFSEQMTNENTLVIRKENKVVSMAGFLAAEYMTVKKDYVPVRYVYAVATLPEYRNRGLATEILKTAQNI